MTAVVTTDPNKGGRGIAAPSSVPSVKSGEVVNVNGTVYAWDPSANGGLGAYVVQGVKEYATLAALLAATPSGNMRATALDAPGSMLAASGANWVGDCGVLADDAAAQAALALCGVGSRAWTVAGALWTKGA